MKHFLFTLLVSLVTASTSLAEEHVTCECYAADHRGNTRYHSSVSGYGRGRGEAEAVAENKCRNRVAGAYWNIYIKGFVQDCK